MRRPQMYLAIAALLYTAGCETSVLAPELRRTLVGNPMSVWLRITDSPSDEGSNTLRALNSGTLEVIGTDRAEMTYTDGTCNLRLAVPLVLGIHEVRASGKPSGTFNCSPLSASSAALTGEIVVYDIDADYQAGLVSLTVGMGRLRWAGSGSRRFTGDAFLLANDPPPPPDAGGGGGGTVDLSNCNSLPAGYSCVTRSGATVRLWYRHPKGPSGWYRNPGMDVCINLMTTGNSTVKYLSGFPSDNGKWGVIVDTKGTPSGSADGSAVNVYTGASDPQIAILTWNTNSRSWVQGGWSTGSC